MTTKTIKAIDFVKQYKSIKKDIDSAISRVLKSGWYILGTEVEQFEKELAAYIGVKHVIGVASGTDALTIAFKVLGIGKGDGVIVPANVYPTSFGVAHSGATLQLVDVDPLTLNVTLDSIKKAVTRKTKAILIVHLYGNPVDISPIKEFAKVKGLFLIEDCAQAVGAEYKNKKVGSFGDIACFSFYPTKNLGAIGDGGAIATNNNKYAQLVKLWRMYGEKGRYESELVGMNSRLDELQAAILRVKLQRLEQWNNKRRSLAKLYQTYLSKCGVNFIAETEDAKSCYHLFVIKNKYRDDIANLLKNNGISTGIHYPVPIHLTKSFHTLGYKRGEFPVSEKACREVLSLPLYPEMNKRDIKYICKLICEFVS